MARTLQGKFRPKNPEKYKGNPGEIYYRSSWEKTFMNWADLNESVHSWQSEEKVVWYYDPVSKKKRRYFPDFIVNYKNKEGVMMTEMVEVKPYKQIIGPPENPKRKTKAWVNSVYTYITNRAKWDAAMKYCEDRGWSFRLVSEKELGLSK